MSKCRLFFIIICGFFDIYSTAIIFSERVGSKKVGKIIFLYFPP